MLFDYRGNTKALDMGIDNDTQVELSCSVVWQGSMYVYGGLQYTDQISKVGDCHLRRIGNLGFDRLFQVTLSQLAAMTPATHKQNC